MNIRAHYLLYLGCRFLETQYFIIYPENHCRLYQILGPTRKSFIFNFIFIKITIKMLYLSLFYEWTSSFRSF